MALCYGVQPKDLLLHEIYDAAVADKNYQSIITAIKRVNWFQSCKKGTLENITRVSGTKFQF
jgi:hypothetical protein